MVSCRTLVGLPSMHRLSMLRPSFIILIHMYLTPCASGFPMMSTKLLPAMYRLTLSDKLNTVNIADL